MFKKTYKTRYISVVLKARSWKRAPMKLLKWKRKMTNKEQDYDLVTQDEYDTRIPLHPDEAFSYGITFEAKYIGTMDVPRPMSRVEIVAAMRRVRYEFKAKGVKKRKVTVDVSIDGVRIITRSKGKRKTSTKFFGRKSSNTAEGSELMHHPIYRIFYVSHDSSDLKIFSYIARDGATNVFKCNVFKSNRKSQAMRIVRTVGQAFEVCHKMQVNSPEQPAPSTSSAADETAPSVSDGATSKEADCGGLETTVSTTKVIVEQPSGGRKEELARPTHLELLPPPPRKEGKRSNQRLIPTPSINLPDLPECVTKVEVPAESGTDANTPLSAHHQLQLLKERLEQQAQHTRAAVAQLLLLRDQLAAEQAARCEAQARTHQLLAHNKDLLEHIAALVAHLQDRERGIARPISAQQLTLLPQKAESVRNGSKTDNFEANKGDAASSDAFIDLFATTTQHQNIENNNEPRLSPYSVSPAPELTNGANFATGFGAMSNEDVQNYLITKFEDMGGFPDDTSLKKFDANQEFYQNSNAFPNIPPLRNHYSAEELESVLARDVYTERSETGLAQAMSVGHSENSLFSPSRDSSSKDSTLDECSSDSESGFIMPLSHKDTLTAMGSDGRLRLIVPVSPAESATEVCETPPQPRPLPTLLTVPAAAAAPITRSTSEKVPNRSEAMTALRSQWTRHTTK